MFPRWSLFTLAILGGCVGKPTVNLVTVRDSAGVEIVESMKPQWADGEGWFVDSVPIVDLADSGSGTGHEFMQVTQVRRLTDGRIVVVDEGTDEIRAYSARGALLRSMGREGEGPGEFQRPVNIEPFRADSLAVWDFWLGRLTVLDRELGLGRVLTTSNPKLRTQQLYWLGDTTFVASVYSREALFDFGPGYYRLPVQIVRLSFQASGYDTIASIAGSEGFNFERGDVSPPFAKRSHLATDRERIIVGTADRMEFRVYTPDGDLKKIIRVPDYDLSISGADLDRELEWLQSPDLPASLRQIAPRLPVPDTKPAYAQVLLDADGYLWASHHRPRAGSDAPQVWEVFTPDGGWLGAVTTPARFKVLSIGRDWLAGVYEDELDVQHPQILSIKR